MNLFDSSGERGIWFDILSALTKSVSNKLNWRVKRYYSLFNQPNILTKRMSVVTSRPTFRPVCSYLNFLVFQDRLA